MSSCYISHLIPDLRVQTYLYSRVGVANQEETHHKMVSFKKTDYSHTLVACFTCDSSIADLSLQVYLYVCDNGSTY